MQIARMWRFFRLAVKSNSCPGNQAHFRIIGTTCANAECEDKCEESIDAFSNSLCVEDDPNKNLANKAAHEHRNFLRHNQKVLQHIQIPINYENDKLKAVDSSLKKIQWGEYLRQREKVFSSRRERNEGQIENSVTSKAKEVEKKKKTRKKKPLKIEDDTEERFGTLTNVSRKFEELPEDDDDIPHPLTETYEKRYSVHTYGRKILALCKEKKLKEALDVLEVEMKVQNVFPDKYCFNILINACGKAGYTKKAFELYYEMKRRGLSIEKYVYTGLFNACANSPFKTTNGLERARLLRKRIKEDEILLHPISYHAMIKAFGHCGDINTAFEIADEMLEMKHNVTTDTMNFLLQACISDTESGFRHALMVWRKMRRLGMRPSIFSYNLLLRCVKECYAGDPHLISVLLEDLSKEQPFKPRNHQTRAKKLPARKVFEKTPLPLTEDEKLVKSSNSNREANAETQSTERTDLKSVCQISDKNKIVKVDLAEDMELEIISPDVVPLTKRDGEVIVLPNILSRNFNPGKVVAISSLERKDERFWLLGGVSGVLESMIEDGVKPTVTTFTYMLESLPPSKETEEALLSSMESCQIVPDVIFCNKLIHRRCLRGSLVEAQEVLELMQKHCLCIDLITFGCLAIGCKKPSDIIKLLRDMNKAGFTPNEQIMGALLSNTLIKQEYVCTIELLQQMKALGIRPNEQILNSLEEARHVIRKSMIEQESAGEGDHVSRRERRKREEMKLFLVEYKYWLKMSKVEFKDHPWAQFGHTDTGQQVATLGS